MSIDWSKAPAHATHWCPGNARIEEGWIYKAGQEFYSCYAEKSCEHIPNFPAWRALRLIPRPVEPAPWSGKGLPPVGTVCEFRVEVDDWRQCEVIAHKDDYAVCWIHCNKIFASSGHAIRPIRTPEQIAAEERNNGIDAILDAYTYTVGPCTHKLTHSQAIRLYDAGIRKVTP